MSTEARIWAKKHTLGNPTANTVTNTRPYSTGSSNAEVQAMAQDITTMIQAVTGAGKVPLVQGISFRSYPGSPAVGDNVAPDNGSRPYDLSIVYPTLASVCPDQFDASLGVPRGQLRLLPHEPRRDPGRRRRNASLQPDGLHERSRLRGQRDGRLHLRQLGLAGLALRTDRERRGEREDAGPEGQGHGTGRGAAQLVRQDRLPEPDRCHRDRRARSGDGSHHRDAHRHHAAALVGGSERFAHQLHRRVSPLGRVHVDGDYRCYGNDGLRQRPRELDLLRCPGLGRERVRRRKARATPRRPSAGSSTTSPTPNRPRGRYRRSLAPPTTWCARWPTARRSGSPTRSPPAWTRSPGAAGATMPT